MSRELFNNCTYLLPLARATVEMLFFFIKSAFAPLQIERLFRDAHMRIKNFDKSVHDFASTGPFRATI